MKKNETQEVRCYGNLDTQTYAVIRLKFMP